MPWPNLRNRLDSIWEAETLPDSHMRANKRPRASAPKKFLCFVFWALKLKISIFSPKNMRFLAFEKNSQFWNFRGTGLLWALSLCWSVQKGKKSCLGRKSMVKFFENWTCEQREKILDQAQTSSFLKIVEKDTQKRKNWFLEVEF